MSESIKSPIKQYVKNVTEYSDLIIKEDDLNEFSTNNSNNSNNEQLQELALKKSYQQIPVFVSNARNTIQIEPINKKDIVPFKQIFDYEKEIIKKTKIFNKKNENKILVNQLFIQSISLIAPFFDIEICDNIIKTFKNCKYIKKKEEITQIIKSQLNNLLYNDSKNEQILKFWKKICNFNNIEITKKNFENYNKLIKLNSKYEKEIKKELDRGFQEYELLKSNSGQEKLYNILLGIANKYSNIGYVQGMNFIAGLLLLQTNDPFLSFHLFDNLLGKLSLEKLFIANFPLLNILNFQTEIFLQNLLPNIYYYLKRNQIEINVFTTKLYMTLFSLHFDINLTTQIWTLLFLFKKKILIKVVLSLFWINKQNIFKLKNDDLYEFIQEMNIKTDKINLFFGKISKLKVTNRLLDQLENYYTNLKNDNEDLTKLTFILTKSKTKSLNWEILDQKNVSSYYSNRLKESKLYKFNSQNGVLKSFIEDIKDSFTSILNPTKIRSKSNHIKQNEKKEDKENKQTYNTLVTEIYNEIDPKLSFARDYNFGSFN